MIYCSNCGKQIPQDSKFCTFCGVQVGVVPVVEPTHAPVTRSRYSFSTDSDFFRSPAFWGSILVLVGFFLPWFKGSNLSGLNIVTQQYSPGKVLLILFPFCALYTLIDTISGFLPGRAGGFFRLIPFILVVVFIALFLSGYKNSSELTGSNVKDLLSKMQIGIWFTLIGSFLMLFHFSRRRSLTPPPLPRRGA